VFGRIDPADLGVRVGACPVGGEQRVEAEVRGEVDVVQLQIEADVP
jgi:hypothetical protein